MHKINAKVVTATPSVEWLLLHHKICRTSFLRLDLSFRSVLIGISLETTHSILAPATKFFEHEFPIAVHVAMKYEISGCACMHMYMTSLSL